MLLALAATAMIAACVTTATGTISFGPPDDPETTFPLNPDDEIEWRAVLPEPVTETSVNLVISPAGAVTELFGYREFVTDPGSRTLTNAMPLGRFLPQPGVYVMRYVSASGQVLAEGEFELVAP